MNNRIGAYTQNGHLVVVVCVSWSAAGTFGQSDSASAQVSLDTQFSTHIPDSNSVASAVGGGGCAGAVLKAIPRHIHGQQPLQRVMALPRQVQAPPPPPPLRQSSAQQPQSSALSRQQPPTPPRGPRHSHSNASLGTASTSSFQI